MNGASRRTALVSGAGAPGGIGFAIARQLKDLGYDVSITATTERIVERAHELGVTGAVADLTVDSECLELIAKIPRIDVLVNNAGMASIGSPLGSDETASLTEITSAAWNRGIKRNLDTAFNLTKAALPKIRNSNAGRIVMIGSVTGGLMAMREQPVYAAAKAALVGLTRAIALDEAKFGITCNVILPGWVATDTQSEHEKVQGQNTPLGRSGTPEEIASLVTYLSSESASYLTGQALVVDGGNSIAEERS
ncbi:MAG: SDR family oxidoreductase [Actinobacteria bacterium]|nr:SDR family oxidoreductase [Actinomycetota bacterium]